ncbi:hypothetical protein IQ238_22865 [Pleurocapsales cyanobacterium LEGE 06147]|nr:hypothetical protein [Pleurocapsales cyanobacterium LEGE 06147]
MKLKYKALVTTFVLSSTVIFITEVQARPTVGFGNGSSYPSTEKNSPEVQPQPTVRFNNGSNPPSTEIKTGSTPTVTGGTTFSCVPQENNYATVGQKGGRQPIPLIVWTLQGASNFGEQFPPQTRCQIVTEKLNAAVTANGGTMKHLLLTNGVVNGKTVICTLSQQQNSCNPDNTLFTLKPENAKRPGEVISQLMQIGRYGSSAGYIEETSGQVYVNLGDWENQVFEATTSP